MPKFFNAWLDKSLPTCIFSSTQLRNFKFPELQSSPWYLECAKNFAPTEEEDEKKRMLAAAGVVNDVVDVDENEDSGENAPTPTLTVPKTIRKGRGKATKSPALPGPSRKKPKSTPGNEATDAEASPTVDPPTIDISQSGRSICKPSVTSVSADLPKPSQLLAQSTLHSFNHGIRSHLHLLNDSISHIMNEKLMTSTHPAALLDIMAFSKKVL